MEFRWSRHIPVSYPLLFAMASPRISGIAPCPAPPGRTARTTGWEFPGSTKTQWEEIPIVFGYVGAIFGPFHHLLDRRYSPRRRGPVGGETVVGPSGGIGAGIASPAYALAGLEGAA